LDVGCGAGAFGNAVKSRLGIEVWGVERNECVAIQASNRLDKVIVGSYPDDGCLPRNYFDCIVFNDSLEHMVDPWTALRATHDFLGPDGHVVASIPNIRYFPVLWKLVLRGEWTYGAAGTLDKTHLRFFTRRSMIRLFEQCDYEVLEVSGINPYQPRFLPFGINVILGEMRWLQYAVVSRSRQRRTDSLKPLGK